MPVMDSTRPLMNENVYDPDAQPQKIITDELSRFGEVLDIRGTVVRTPTRGTVVDNVKILVQPQAYRVPLTLTVKWDNVNKRFQYFNVKKDRVQAWKYEYMVEQKIRMDRKGYADIMGSPALDATQDVFSRWKEHDVWTLTNQFDGQRISYSQQLRWDRAIKDWNSDVEQQFTKIFRDSTEQGLFFERLLDLSEHYELEDLKNFGMVLTGNHISTRFGRNPIPAFSENFTAVPFPVRGPLVGFAARHSNSWMDLDIRYDGTHFFYATYDNEGCYSSLNVL